MAFLSKLFGKKDKDESKAEAIAETQAEIDEAEELTDEEIEAAEKFEQENAEEISKSEALEIDGEFSEFALFKQEQEAEEIASESADRKSVV